MTPSDVRVAVGRTLHGEVLEIGPGFQPFPVPAAAHVTYADRSVEGGRDATWPELLDQPKGPQADVDVDLDVDGLGAFRDGSFDAVIASHIIEHLANPIAALTEMHRVLRPGGRLVLLVPDRGHTFDAGRHPTPLSHLLDEHRRGVTQVDEDHIREFCAAIYAGPVIHPDEVRQWHDPDRLDASLIALHRRRTIHVHCWAPEEFAALVVGVVAAGLAPWGLVDLYLRDDLDGDAGDEFGLVLERPTDSVPRPPSDQAADMVRTWTEAVLSSPRRDVGRIGALEQALRRDIGGWDDAAETTLVPVTALAREVARLRGQLGDYDRELSEAHARLASVEGQLASALTSRALRVGRALTAPGRVARRIAHRRVVAPATRDQS
jgi:SAM-dependent methyltransferase